MIYISTGGFYKKTAFQAAKELIDAGCDRIELSAGMYDENLRNELRTLSDIAFFRIHNYFPPLEIPIVLNLASLDSIVANATIDHIKKSIEWSTELGQSTYSFHAGFLMDPKVQELGKRVLPRTLFDRAESMSRFIERVNLIDDYAQALGVEILIENNVLSANNFMNFKSNPFLMASADECIDVMKATSNNVRLLVDVAHLKVSATTLGYDPVEFLSSCADWIGAYHLSDNDGTRDCNDPIRDDSWFWPHLKRNLDYYSLEVYGISPIDLIHQRDLAERRLEDGVYEDA